MSACNGHLELVEMLLERGVDVHAVNGPMAKVKHHTKNRYEKKIERSQIYSGSMVLVNPEKGETRSFTDLNDLSDWHFDFIP